MIDEKEKVFVVVISNVEDRAGDHCIPCVARTREGAEKTLQVIANEFWDDYKDGEPKPTDLKELVDQVFSDDMWYDILETEID